ncbi:hypothetical protein [Aeromicrobium sp. 9AM]|uniref:hypothetical protein n=1 Tax=Aeromicrobium sp. 9AM TaxID=2653126 RepID=UPI0012F429FF|nr:hypothetical protein [Aeromicrobium sp. 9AM]VXB82575.1 conserved hypothetical protein [Aeromicrobium sp. 9AM]
MTTRTVQDISINLALRVDHCITCGVVFGVGDDFRARRKEDHRNYYCPNGHQQHYIKGSSQAEKLQAELERTRTREKNQREYAERERERRLKAERERAAARGQVTKIKNRVGNGVCPCCNRTFANLGRHISGQHPDFISK